MEERNALNQLLRLNDDIPNGVAKQSYVLGVFLDIENAFDKVWKKGVLYKMEQV